ncbi:hypothetical protein CSOJ01_11019 [Colletotrichum sojae]|uniref:BTB domain-containing protein n=1 Tax=Colletotrichum sojae TaxID=2175907 RepID=A0A8H6MPE1_9PEZI|nr:hypothetical protein CSOJ01_11019 [Colletotrichum sojae]
MASRTVAETDWIYSSRTIRLFVGPDKRVFAVHENLIVRHSSVFAAMLDTANGMSEAIKAEATLGDTQPSTFASFIDWATYGDYKFHAIIQKTVAAKPQPPKDAAAAKGEDQHESFQQLLQQYPPDLIAKKLYLLYMQWFVYSGLPDGLYRHPRPELTGTAPADDDFDADLDLAMENREFGERCYHHVQVFVFADCYNIPELRQFCLHKLHRCLQRAKLSDEGYQLLFELIAIAYDNTGEGDPLRKLFVQACVADLCLIRRAPGFSSVLDGVPEVAADIFREQPKYWDCRLVALCDVEAKFKRPESDSTPCERGSRKERSDL